MDFSKNIHAYNSILTDINLSARQISLSTDKVSQLFYLIKINNYF